MKQQIEQIRSAVLQIVSIQERHTALDALSAIESRYKKIEDALNMNTAIYEMLFSAVEGDISAEDLSIAINKAMELNQEALGLKTGNGGDNADL